MPEFLQLPLLEVGEQPLQDIATFDVHIFGWAFLSPAGYVHTSRPGFRVTHPGYAGHLMGNNAAELLVGKTPI